MGNVLTKKKKNYRNRIMKKLNARSENFTVLSQNNAKISKYLKYSNTVVVLKNMKEEK